MPAIVTKPARIFHKTAETFQAGAKTLPQRYFVSPQIFAEEQEKIFSRQWVLVGHKSQLAQAADYFTSEVAGESLIIVRDKRGEIHGFYNVCRHRGSCLIENRNGQLSAAIQCPYHAWTYGLDGRLLGAPHMDDVPGFNKADYSLRPVNVALWGGFMRIASDKSLTMSGHTCALPVGDFGDEDFRFVFYYSIFPNMLMSLHPDYVMVHQLEPQSPERTLILCDWFFHPDAFKRVDFRPDDAIEFWDMVNRQDWHVCELSQQGIASRTYQPGPYSSRESIPAAWDRYYHWRLDS